MTTIHKIFLGVMMAAVAVVVIAFFWLSLTNARLRVQVAALQGKMQACLLANNTFAEHIAQQNKAVHALKAQTEAQNARVQKAALAAKEKANAFFNAADRLRKTNPPGDACRAANALLDMYLKETL